MGDKLVLSIMRCDLINYFLKEPVEMSCNFHLFPTIKRLILYPTRNSVEEQWPSEKPAKVSAFLETSDNENVAEYEVQRQAEEFMNLVCWLLSLQELHDVYYWGTYHYVKSGSTWRLRSSLWKPALIKEWKPSGVSEGTVTYWRLPEFLSRAMTIFSDEKFHSKEFILALHLFLDSLPTDQLAEIRFVKKWSAFESLINDQAEEDGYLFIFRERGSQEFSSLKSELKRVIDTYPDVLANPNSNEPLTKQLAALERMPVKMISKRFLNDHHVNYDEHDLNKIVNLRNDILHYIRTDKGLKEVRRLERVLRAYPRTF